ncbi:hypothetical protein PGTUg99_026669 [Puccinia graminis f. sp. tritici]|uniref:Uncharacterized protein n=1 Tax=Puccinia graminis f. sp. tritici TaxID=56615 RepID=A0A5B0REU2_PUCGR|nr:hypothetical protein PGTUg99_026669 [Puccinia graminis f. sp. tritici]
MRRDRASFGKWGVSMEAAPAPGVGRAWASPTTIGLASESSEGESLSLQRHLHLNFSSLSTPVPSSEGYRQFSITLCNSTSDDRMIFDQKRSMRASHEATHRDEIHEGFLNGERMIQDGSFERFNGELVKM